MTYNNSVVFVETTTFTTWITSYFEDEDYRELQKYLMEHPEAGKIITGSGGIRKFRWGHKGSGKSGGVRIIYYWAKTRYQIHLLTAYAKNEKENIDKVTLAKIAKQLGGIK